MIATTVQTNQVQTAPTPLISPEIMALALDKTVASQVIAWDTFGQIRPEPEEIKAVFTNHDILKFVLSSGGAILIGADQFLNYWELICSQKRELVDADQPTQEMIVSLAKESGTAIYEAGCKIGYVAKFKNGYYAVTEVLAYGKGFQYSYSRHSSFQMAVNSLIEQSYEEVA